MTPSPQQNEYINKTSQHMIGTMEEMNKIASDYVEATMRSSAALTQGMGEIVRTLSGFLQESTARAMNAGKTIAGTKSVKEALDTHSEFLKDSFDHCVEGTGKVSEISARMTQDVVGPITQHASNAMSKIAEKAKAA